MLTCPTAGSAEPPAEHVDESMLVPCAKALVKKMDKFDFSATKSRHGHRCGTPACDWWSGGEAPGTLRPPSPPCGVARYSASSPA
jgi:hypothetical protein